MKRKTLVFFSLMGALSISASLAVAAGQPGPPVGLTVVAGQPAQEIRGTQEQQIYGGKVMEEEERIEYHTKMRVAKTVEERELLREEHHQRMQERAKLLGVYLSDEPPAEGGGMRMGGSDYKP